MHQLLNDDQDWIRTMGPNTRAHRRELPRLMVQLSHFSDQLPRALFLLDVKKVGKTTDRGGGSADIYGATLNHQRVALKRLRCFMNTTPPERQKLSRDLSREALLWRHLRHPNVLQFLGVDNISFTGMPCMVLPWVERGNILQHIKGLRPHPSSMQLNIWLRDIAAGMTYLHTEAIIHGDLRCSNILVADNGLAQLTHFGLSVFADERSRSHHSLRGGAARWLAPEILDPSIFERQSSRPTYASDVYSFGCLCVELYTRKRPFDEFGDLQIFNLVLGGVRPSRPTLSDGTPMSEYLWPWVNACWCHNREDRPQMGVVWTVMTVAVVSKLGKHPNESLVFPPTYSGSGSMPT